MTVVFPERKLLLVPVGSYTSTSCEPGEDVPTVPVKTSVLGCTMGATSVPAGSTCNTATTSCGVLAAPDEITFTSP